MNRKGTYCYKWDMVDQLFRGKDLLPMWVADMDLLCPEAVTEAIIERAKHPIYGYTYLDSGYPNAVIRWMKDHQDMDVRPSDFVLCNGVLQAITQCIQLYTNPGDAIIIQAPVYSMFRNIIEHNNRRVLNVPMIEKGNTFEIDHEALSEAMNIAPMMLFCNPHNPIGKVYSSEDVRKIAELARRKNCFLIADEIHADLVHEPGMKHDSLYNYTNVHDRFVICQAPSKTFNIAGFHISNIFIKNNQIRKRFTHRIDSENHSQISSPIAIAAAKAAYEHGNEWLEETKQLIRRHYEIVVEFAEEHMPDVKVAKLEGTYLVWLHIDVKATHKEINDALINIGKIALGNGMDYGNPEGDRRFRINIATDDVTLMDGLNRVKKSLDALRR